MIDLNFVTELVIYSLVSLNVYMSMRIAGFCDMTCDGSFALGACAFVTAVTLGCNVYLALLVAALSGACSGVYTAFLVTKFNINSLLAGIITVTSLQSFNCKLLGGVSSIPMNSLPQHSVHLVAIISIVAIVFFLVFFFLNSKFGLAIRGIGGNIKISDQLGIQYSSVIKIMLAIGNACVGLAGALFITTQKTVTPTSGSGAIMVGLIAMLVGEKFIEIKTVFSLFVAVLLGTFFYEIILLIATHDALLGISPMYENLITGVAIVFLYILKDIKDKDDRD